MTTGADEVVRKSSRSFGENSPLPARLTRWLFRYVLSITTLAFYGRAMPGPFLPLTLQNDFGAPASVVGYVTAAYPLAALLVTTWTTRYVRNNECVVRTHSIAFIVMSLTICTMAFAVQVYNKFGYNVAIAFMIMVRMAQGMSFSLYIAANTAIVTRFFPKDAPYIIAMIEVAVGVGGQFGRVVGGFLFDTFGFEVPFVSLAIVQALWALIGFVFPANPPPACSSSDSESGTEGHTPVNEDVPWRSLMTPRTCVGMSAIYLNYFQAGFYDATFSPFALKHLHLTCVSVISIIMAVRSLSYLVTSYMCAEAMHRHLVSFEHMIMSGAAMTAVSLVLLAPAPFLISATTSLHIDLAAPHVSWTLLMFAVVLGAAGPSMLFVPSLPLMQSEAQHLGTKAVEQVSSLFMIMFSIGEASGPILGGWLVQLFTFGVATTIILGPYLCQLAAAILTYDRAVAQHRTKPDANSMPLLSTDKIPEEKNRSVKFVLAGLDDSALLWRELRRQMPADADRCESAPSSVFRRRYQQVPVKQDVPSTAPSTSFRRVYTPTSPKKHSGNRI